MSRQTVNCLAISEDDLTLASGSEDASIRIWDTCTRQCIKIISHAGRSCLLAFSGMFVFFISNVNAMQGPVTNVAFKHRTLFFNDEPNVAPALLSVRIVFFFSLFLVGRLVACHRLMTERMQGLNNIVDAFSSFNESLLFMMQNKVADKYST